jgi:hypothetical protein
LGERKKTHMKSLNTQQNYDPCPQVQPL